MNPIFIGVALVLAYTVLFTEKPTKPPKPTVVKEALRR